MNTYFEKPNEYRKDLIEVEIGDSKVDAFMPQVKLMRHNNEYNLSVRYKHNTEGKESHEIKDGKYIWKKGKEEAHIYKIEDGYEIEAVLNEKPESNVVEFTLQTKGIKFYYQPELTQEEILRGHQRPENVVGSYAIYAEKIKKTYRGGKEYGTGKIGHIYRPKCIDAKGNEIWADLNINDLSGILSVTIPKHFLDTAVYPVIVDPTIGYNVAGGSSAVAGSADMALANISNNFVAGTGDTCTGISFYAKKNNNNESVTVCIYSVSGGNPDIRTGTESTINVNSTTAQWWNTPTTSDSLSNGVEYCVAYGSWGGTVGSENTRVYYDSGPSGSASFNNSNSTTGTWSETATGAVIFSIYATVLRPPIDINYSYTIFIDKAKL